MILFSRERQRVVLVVLIDLVVPVVLVVGDFVAVLAISDLRLLVELEMLRFKSLTWPCLLPLGVVMKSCVRTC